MRSLARPRFVMGRSESWLADWPVSEAAAARVKRAATQEDTRSRRNGWE